MSEPSPSLTTITPLQPSHFAALEALQRTCYPTLGAAELMRVPHFASQYQVFAEGQFVALADGQVVGQGSGFFCDFDFDHPGHRFAEFCDGFYFRHHQPDGAYYYGADLSVHPDYRGRGIGRRLYAARKELVRRRARRGIVAGALLPGYAALRRELSVADYVAEVVAGRRSDPTLSFQLAQGFVVRGLLPGYIDDSASDGYAALIVWENRD